jgi:hypothetical protein
MVFTNESLLTIAAADDNDKLFRCSNVLCKAPSKKVQQTENGGHRKISCQFAGKVQKPRTTNRRMKQNRFNRSYPANRQRSFAQPIHEKIKRQSSLSSEPHLRRVGTEMKFETLAITGAYKRQKV